MPSIPVSRQPAIVSLRYLLRLTSLLLLLSVCAFPAFAQAPKPTALRIATRVVPPFVMLDDQGQLTGFSIELWRAIALQMNTASQFQAYPTVTGLLDAVRTHKADVGVADVSITAKRDQYLDFSQPIYASGLQIMVRESSRHHILTDALRNFFSPEILQLLGIIVLIVLIPANIVWLVERHHPTGIVVSKSYFPGIFQSIWWAASTLATQAEEMPKSNLGRIVAVIWMFVSVVFVAYFTAAVTSSLTVQQLNSDIKGPDDLPGKRVATLQGSTSDLYLRKHHAKVTDFTTLDDASAALEKDDVDAIVFDAPALQYFAAHDGKGAVQMAGPVFLKEDYGIVVPPDSPLRKSIDTALLALRENGSYEQLYDHWFGDSGSGG